MVKLVLSSFYRLLCSRFALIFLLALLIFGIFVAGFGDMYTPAKLQKSIDEISWWGVQNVLDLHDVDTPDEAMEVLRERQLPDSFYRVTAEAILFIVMLLPLIVINRDCVNRTLNTDILHHSRPRVIIARLFTVHILTIVYCVILLIYMIGKYASFHAAPVNLYVRNFALAALISVAVGSVTAFISAALRKPVSSLVVSFAVVYLATRTDSVLFPINAAAYDGIWSADAAAGDIMQVVVVSLTYVVLFTVLSATAFSRAELK